MHILWWFAGDSFLFSTQMAVLKLIKQQSLFACYAPRVLLPQPMISTINIDLDFIYIYIFIVMLVMLFM